MPSGESLIVSVKVPPRKFRRPFCVIRPVTVCGSVGLEADVFDAAQNQAALYGAVAVLISLVSGYLAGLIFRRE